MSKIMNENFSFLDGMHEGLIVISEADKSLQFATRPAIALLKSLPETDPQTFEE